MLACVLSVRSWVLSVGHTGTDPLSPKVPWVNGGVRRELDTAHEDVFSLKPKSITACVKQFMLSFNFVSQDCTETTWLIYAKFGGRVEQCE